MVQTAIDRAAPGVRKNDLVADIMHAGITGVDDDWGDYPAIVPLTPSGLDATAAHLTWNGAPMRAGEATFFELSGCYRRYHAPLCRTIFLGTPSDEMRRVEAAQIDGASPPAILRFVILPHLRRYIEIAVLMVFLLKMDIGI